VNGDVPGALGDSFAWVGEHLAPIVTGVSVGLALRAVAIFREVNDHDARAEELGTDLTRWVHDRSRQLDAESFNASNLARQGVLADVAQMSAPESIEHLPPGSQEHSGAFVNYVAHLMRRALHEYRDEASGKVREYRAMARSDRTLHRLIRRWWYRQKKPPPCVFRGRLASNSMLGGSACFQSLA
jgi:hypothetical protein